MSESIHIAEHINRSPAEVYAYVSNLDNLPTWAQGVTAEMNIRFAAPNDFGVLDHWAIVEGTTYYNPMRVVEHDDGSEIVFTLRNPTADDRAAIAADLATLKTILEATTAG